MRTTIHIPDDLLAEYRRLAAKSNRTLTSVITDALREALARRRKRAPGEAVRLTTFHGGGLQPGVDLDDSAALLDRMESE
jgi:hypothetical protein